MPRKREEARDCGGTIRRPAGFRAGPRPKPRRAAAVAILASAVAGSLPAASRGPAPLDLLPVPAEVVRVPGVFRLSGAFSIAPAGETGDRARKAAVRFMARLAGKTGLFFEQDYLGGPATGFEASLLYKAERPGSLELGEDESYALTISPDRVLLVGRTELGVLRGFETVLQLLDADGEGFILPCLQIRDGPRFPWRGLLLDAGRHFLPVEVVKRNIDGMAAVKLNVLHWHLTEHQGFRVESRVFPELHEKGSDGDFYTQDQVREIVAYAADRGIRVVPEFDVPGHSTSWFAAFPEFASAPGPYAIARRLALLPAVFNPAKAEVYAFFERFLTEMAGLFPDRYVHLGGDEVDTSQWDENADIRRFKVERGLPDNAALQAHFMGRLRDILATLGRTMIGWDEILEPSLDRGVVIQCWRDPGRMLEAVRAGHPALLSNGYYLDLCLPASTHYLDDPVPSGVRLSRAEARLVLGGEAAMWTELVNAETVDSRLWPRLAAVAERFWSPREVRDVEDMYRRLDIAARDLEDLGLTHFRNQDVLLRRLARGGDLSPLKILADVVEPVKMYRRLTLGTPYTQLSPLARFVDAALPESATARRFAGDVRAFLADRRSGGPEIRGLLAKWRDQRAALAPLLDRSPALREIEPLSSGLSASASLGLLAMDAIEGLSDGGSGLPADAAARLSSARAPRGDAELAVLGAIEALVRAAVGAGPARRLT